MKNEIMTLRQLSEYLQISQRSIRRMIRRGDIPAIKVANRWRFKRSKINEWLTMNSEKVCGMSKGGDDVQGVDN